MRLDINEAEKDGTLDYTASTYDAVSDRLKPGIGIPGPRVLNFESVLGTDYIRLNDLIKKLLKVAESSAGAPVEIEFALTLKKDGKLSPKFGFLQVRPMVVTNEVIDIEKNINKEKVLFYSEKVLGNGKADNISDIVFVKPENFNIKYSEKIAAELKHVNDYFMEQNRKYLLIGYGRWGSTDPWLGIPVDWGNISCAKVIVEMMLPDFDVELSQGSHFFHNINGFRVLYFSVKSDEAENTDWKWINEQEVITEKEFIKHIKLKKPMAIYVDGRKAIGVIEK
jgi:hypothetical protein